MTSRIEGSVHFGACGRRVGSAHSRIVPSWVCSMYVEQAVGRSVGRRAVGERAEVRNACGVGDLLQPAVAVAIT